LKKYLVCVFAYLFLSVEAKVTDKLHQNDLECSDR